MLYRLNFFFFVLILWQLDKKAFFHDIIQAYTFLESEPKRGHYLLMIVTWSACPDILVLSGPIYTIAMPWHPMLSLVLMIYTVRHYIAIKTIPHTRNVHVLLFIRSTECNSLNTILKIILCKKGKERSHSVLFLNLSWSAQTFNLNHLSS